jgi:hypothetical protein
MKRPIVWLDENHWDAQGGEVVRIGENEPVAHLRGRRLQPVPNRTAAGSAVKLSPRGRCTGPLRADLHVVSGSKLSPRIAGTQKWNSGSSQNLILQQAVRTIYELHSTTTNRLIGNDVHAKSFSEQTILVSPELTRGRRDPAALAGESRPNDSESHAGTP